MVERLFFSKLVTKDLTAISSSRRLFEGVLTVEMKDRQGEITIRDELLKVLPIWIARGGPITDTHSNRVVGQGINFGSTTVTDENGKSYPAITIQGEIFRDYELDDEIWKAIKSGKYKGLSFGGATKSDRTPIMQKDGSVAYSLKDLEQYEVAVCEEPAVPLALITQHNEIAKAMAGKTIDRGDGKMCIRCDKFKCYVDKGDDTYSDVRGPNTPNEDEDSEALENNRGEPQENGATYHGTDKGVKYSDPNPKELNPDKIMENAKNPKTTITLDADMKKDEKAMDEDEDEMLEEADLEEVEKRTTEGDEVEYDQTNDAGEKVNRFGRKMPKVMQKKPSQVDTAQDKPGTRHSTRVAGVSDSVTPSSPNMSEGQLKRRQSGLTGQGYTKPQGDKVGGKKVKPGPTVTHDHKTGTTTVDNSTSGRGSQGKVTMPTDRYISNFTSKRKDMKNTFDLLRLLFTVKSGVNDYNTCEVVREYDDNEKEKEVQKIENSGTTPYTEPGRGGFAGREPGKTCDHNESTSIHNVNQPKHVNRPYEDEEAEALKKEIGDVYHPGNAKFDPKNTTHQRELGVRWEDAKETNTNKKPATSSTGYGGDSCSNSNKGMTMVDINNRDNGGRCIGAACAKKPKARQNLSEPGTYHCEDCGKESASRHASSLAANMKNDRAMTANNAEDGINGKMRLDDDPPAEALEKQQNEKVYDGKDRPGQVTRPNATTQDEDGDYPTEKTKDTGVMDPGSGSGGIRTGSSYDNAQQDTGQKDNPREVKEEEYTGEEDRGNLNEKYTGEEDTVTGSSTENYNKASITLTKLLFDLKKHF